MKLRLYNAMVGSYDVDLPLTVTSSNRLKMADQLFEHLQTLRETLEATHDKKDIAEQMLTELSERCRSLEYEIDATLNAFRLLASNKTQVVDESNDRP